MGGKFLNTTMQTTISNLVSGVAKKIDNPFYVFTDKHPTICTFYNVNTTRSTLDEGTKQIAELKGVDSPLRYNKITNVFIYGLEKIQADLEVGDYGLEASSIEGECILPPNTFMPIQDSYFTIDHITKGVYWFRITKVTVDTLENGSNFWKMEYTLDDDGDIELESKIIKHFRFFADNVGSNYKSVVDDESCQLVERVENIIESLQTFYHKTFFKDSLQTYVYQYQDEYFYDPETIEFIIRNKIMTGSNYIYIDQACDLPITFPISYSKSIYHFIEMGSKDFVFHRYYGVVIDDPMSLMSTRLEDYYLVTSENFKLLAEPIDTFSKEFMSAVLKNTKYTDYNAIYNIISNFFYEKKPLDDDMVKSITDIPWDDNTEIFHMVPVIIFILNQELEKIMILTDTARNLM